MYSVVFSIYLLWGRGDFNIKPVYAIKMVIFLCALLLRHHTSVVTSGGTRIFSKVPKFINTGTNLIIFAIINVNIIIVN